jgi:hypothetical protein
MKTLVLAVSLALPALAAGQSPTECPMHKQTPADDHAIGVDTRGDHAMGFSHEKSAHHFRLLSDGGAIEIVANEPNDSATRDKIRAHLSHITQMFTEGDFQVPMFIHDKVPPGVPVMESRRTAIAYTFEPLHRGGRVRIATADKDALEAIHQFLAFQIEDHRTGDTKSVESLR